MLLAIVAGMYAAYHGPDGLRAIATEVAAKAAQLGAALSDLGVELEHHAYFDTVTAVVPGGRAAEVVRAARARGVDLRLADADRVGIAVDETTPEQAVAAVAAAFADVLGGSAPQLPESAPLPFPEVLARTSDYLTHEWFASYRSETAMMRLLRRLSDHDLALDRTMIPLGSCTMKLNAATEMEPITWPGFADLHPFAPADEPRLCRAHRRAGVVAGRDHRLRRRVGPAQRGQPGEFAGLLAIRAYLASRGEGVRDVCLIPSSAHGTNAASAVMAGLRVVVVACDEQGNVDLDDLRAKIDAHAASLAALMITYPSTHGVFEETVQEVCGLVHAAGGQVYLDGANLNALVGLAAPGSSAQMCRTSTCTRRSASPRRGWSRRRAGGRAGAPGAVPAWAPTALGRGTRGSRFRRRRRRTGQRGAVGQRRGAAHPLCLHPHDGAEGLTAATRMAILSANYLAARLAPYYPVLYSGPSGLVAHECIIDLRQITKETGVTVDDVAKRLIDFGFHAPTMSFPVAGTLMIEPTESEDLAELDRFVDAMAAIRGEIDRVAAGEWTAADSPLRHAPHTARCVVGPWDRTYTREEGAFPAAGAGGSVEHKYWPPVRRVDNVYGDRNLQCACPPPEAFQDSP